jgi:Protein of unknown function (DUF3095)
MPTDFFYAELPVLHDFWGVADSRNFVQVPDDWYILVTDIVGSTAAIAVGQYKTVNLLGASSITAVLNVTQGLEVPFIFGGDGAVILVPPTLLEPARQALLATQRFAREQFQIDLRVGAVPVAIVSRQHYALKVAKFQATKHYSQANFTGGGLTYATDLVKDDRPDNPYQLESRETFTQKPNFTGLECRWQDIPSQPGQTISLIVAAIDGETQQKDGIYRRVFEQIRAVYGEDQACHPVGRASLNLTMNLQKLQGETKLRSRSSRWCDRLAYLGQIGLQTLIGRVLMRFRLKSGGVDWGAYKDGVISTTDYRKFDDLLRMVIVGTAAQTEQLTQYLEQEFSTGKLVYGLHISDRALMTCLVFERNGRQVHFIDGADGGYALAAKALKQRLHTKATNWRTYRRLLNHRHRTSK